jgi:signal transduction histidine kinase
VLASPRYCEIAARTHELERDSLIGRPWQELALIVADDKATTIWNSVLESRVPFRLAEAHLTIPQDNQETIWNWTLSPIPPKEQQEPVRFMLVSAIEITEQARALAEVEHLNRLRDDFLSLTSHELRTPLTSMLGNAELLQLSMQQQSNASGETGSKHDFTRDVQTVGRIIHQIQRLNQLINEMLDITRIQGNALQLNKQQNVNIVELAQKVVEQYTGTTPHPIQLETNEQVVVGTWDEGRLEQVLINLVSNAIK